ncbi:hypothetical protein O181_026745 [Austropuccinia psidii MF-1]|uniref:RNA helicase n=1 Tax=Austropuccinia psidii MF-1 TaxID=1389203 RepID=A0A9Q3H2H3_9BASI|nr:hypothetical protein [Austropuccinia psidii MF-1]
MSSSPATQNKPKRRPNILRSGNAGNSSKTTSTTNSSTPLHQNQTPSLFPPGSKTPVQLLHERCRHNGWDKPSIHHKPSQDGRYTAIIILSKPDKKDLSIKQTVRFEPHPPLHRATIEEAKHWGATYALFRFCNNMPLHLVLPPGPKEFWASLLQDKKSAPAHRSWEFDPDPFQAAIEVKKRQQNRQERINQSEHSSESQVNQNETFKKLPHYWSKAPQVKIDLKLRDQIEQIIRKHLTQIPQPSQTLDSSSTSSSNPPNLYPISTTQREKFMLELTQLGFRPGHVSSAIDHLSNFHSSSTSSHSSRLFSVLINSLKNSNFRDALIQYLSIVVPEDDLPLRFRPTQKSTSFVTAFSKNDNGTDQNSLQANWLIDRLSKQHGFPIQVVTSVVNGPIGLREEVALETLVRRLAGWDDHVPLAHAHLTEQTTQEVKEMLRSRDEKRSNEKEALESIYSADRFRFVSTGPNTVFEIKISSQIQSKDDLWLRVFFHPYSLYPTPKSSLSESSLPTFSILSTTIPSYLRLALLKSTMEQFRQASNGWDSMLQAGEGGLIFEMVNHIEEAWSSFSESPPDVADVMLNFVFEKIPILAESTVEKPNHMSKKPIPTAQPSFKVQALTRNKKLDSDLLHKQSLLSDNPTYLSVLNGRKNLPAWSSRSEFLDALVDSDTRVTVVAGETGSGKTTQLPQFVIEAEFKAGRGSLVNIICTQPRKVSAIGVATRVASERLEDIDKKGGIVGYSIRGESKLSSQTRLLFATSGVLIRRLATSDPDLLGVSHLFIDEVHERSLESDLLLLELRDLLARNKTIKIILMSATANQNLFVEYFGKAKKMNIPGIMSPVQNLYLEDYLNKLNYAPIMRKSDTHKCQKAFVASQKQRTERLLKHYSSMGYNENESRYLISTSDASRYIDEHLISSIVAYILQDYIMHMTSQVILIFVSGLAEIRSACKAIESLCGKNVECIPLHSQLSNAEQKRVFDPPSASKVKVVVSTNIAETSITIPNVCYVIDSGREKQIRLDVEGGISRLIEVNCSQAAAHQRRGRAGRTPGITGFVFKLYTKDCDEYEMPKYTEPEISRMPLETIFLQIKAIRDQEDVATYLQKALTPPPKLAIDHAIETLEVVGAFQNGELTALGKHLSQLPIDLRLGKLLIFGTIFRVLEPTLTLAAMLSVNKSIFYSPYEKRDDCNLARIKFGVANSDLLTNINAFNEFMRIKKVSGNNAAREFCQVNFLSTSTIREIQASRSDLLGQMQERGFVSRSYRFDWSRISFEKNEITDDEIDLNENSEKLNLIKSIFAAGLSQLVRIELPETKYDQMSSGAIAKDVDSKAVKFFDQKLGRVFLQPSSILFKLAKNLKAGFLTYFSRSATGSDVNSKVFLRDATEVPLLGILLLFGTGSIQIYHEFNGLAIKTRLSGVANDDEIKLRSSLRIGSLCNQLRNLLDSILSISVDEPNRLSELNDEKEVIECVINLIECNGLESRI